MKKKMFIAGMSLVIALVLLATASFAWMTMSTAPEVKGMEVALYTDRTLLLAPGDGTNTAPDSDEFKQYISLADAFAGLAPLRPVSTADGVNWYLPAYNTEDGSIGQVGQFVLDDTLEHGNVSIVDSTGKALTDDALNDALSRSYYVYTDIWMMTEEPGAKVRLSIPHIYGTSEARHAGTVTEYGLNAEELQQAVYGTYVLGEPKLDESDSTKLADRTEEPEKALRIGFLIYQDTETLDPVSDGISGSGIPEGETKLPFKIYEPNAEKRTAGTQEELLLAGTDGSQYATRQSYIAGSAEAAGLQDNTYYVTMPFAKAEDGMPTLTTVSAEDMIVQLSSAWDDVSVVKTLNGQQKNGIKKASSNDVAVFGEFLKIDESFTQPGGIVNLSDTDGMTDIAGSNVIVELKQDTPVRVRLFVWLEGQDVDCWNDIATGSFRINLELAGETVYREEEEEPEEPEEPAPLVTCTLKGYGTDGNSSDGWFDSTAAGISRNKITALEFVKSVPAGYTAIWNAGTGTGDEAINAYVTGTTVSIVLPEGADKIALPVNSGSIFSGMTACTSIGGMGCLDTSSVTKMNSMFEKCYTLASLDVSGFDTSAVTNMSLMFRSCNILHSLDASGFDTSKVTDMHYMFYCCSGLTSLDVSGFDTSAVTDMYNMFGGCYNLPSLDVSGFDTSAVTDMCCMFAGCSKLTSLDVSGFDTSAVTDMSNMFYDCYNLTSLDVSGFDTSAVTNMYRMFYGCKELTSLDVSGFDTSAVTNMSLMFIDCSSLTTIYAGSGFTTSNVTTSLDMFTGCTALVGGNGTPYSSSYKDKTYARIDQAGQPGYFTDIADDPSVVIGTLKIRDLYSDNLGDEGWFDSNEAEISIAQITSLEFTKTVPNGHTATWNAGTGTGAEAISAYLTGTTVSIVLPAGADKIALPAYSNSFFSEMSGCTAIIGAEYLDTSNVTDMEDMFSGCSKLTYVDVSSWNTSNVTNMKRMFRRCRCLSSLDVSGFDTSSVTDMTSMFEDCSNLGSLNVSGFDTSKVTNMADMFSYCNDLVSLDLHGFNTSKVTDMSGMFGYCWDLRSLNVSGFDTSAVTDMHYMFFDCGRLTSLDLSSFNTSKTKNMSNMFYYCNRLTTIYASSSFTTSAVQSSASMFLGCYDLVGGNGTPYSTSNYGKTYARIDTASTPGYFTAK